MSIPPPSSLDRPKSSGNAPDALYGKRAAEPPGIPPRRKRQKIEYVPLQRTVETYASWDLGQVEDVVQQAAQRKRPRTLHDLGEAFPLSSLWIRE